MWTGREGQVCALATVANAQPSVNATAHVGFARINRAT